MANRLAYSEYLALTMSLVCPTLVAAAKMLIFSIASCIAIILVWLPLLKAACV